jgi:hypothetical protein
MHAFRYNVKKWGQVNQELQFFLFRMVFQSGFEFLTSGSSLVTKTKEHISTNAWPPSEIPFVTLFLELLVRISMSISAPSFRSTNKIIYNCLTNWEIQNHMRVCMLIFLYDCISSSLCQSWIVQVKVFRISYSLYVAFGMVHLWCLHTMLEKNTPIVLGDHEGEITKTKKIPCLVGYLSLVLVKF